MQKIFLILVSLIITSFSYAFEGIINQTYTDINTKEKSTFKWTISGDNVRLDILKGDDVITILPQLQSNAIAYFGNKADQNGVFWYSTSPVSQIEAKVPNMRILEQNESQYKAENAKEIKLMSSEGLIVVQYLPNIAINMKNMLLYFAESKEFKAISLAGDFGFPVSSVVMTEKDAIYTLSTESIQEKPISLSDFKVPSNYRLFDSQSIK